MSRSVFMREVIEQRSSADVGIGEVGYGSGSSA